MALNVVAVMVGGVNELNCIYSREEQLGMIVPPNVVTVLGMFKYLREEQPKKALPSI